MVDVKKNPSSALVWWLGFGLMLVAVFSRLALSCHDTLDFDGYALMVDVEKSFAEFSKTSGQFMFPQRLHYWITYRIIGNDFSDYVLGSAIASALTVVAIYFGVSRYFGKQNFLPHLMMGLVIFNAHAIYLGGYPMFSYAMSFLVAVVLFFTFLHLASDLNARVTARWIPIVILGAIFSNLTVTVPVITGIVSAYLCRLYMFGEARGGKGVLEYAKAAWPLLIIPVVLKVIYILQPLTNMGRDRRPDMDPYFFFSDIYGTGIQNAIRFLNDRTIGLFSELVGPVKLSAIGWLLVFAVMSTLVASYRRHQAKSASQEESAVSATAVGFTIIFLVLTTAAIAFGGLITAYPYGTARYANYLILPTLLLVACCGHLVITNLLELIGSKPWMKLAVVLGLVTLLAVSVKATFKEYQRNTVSNTRVHGVIQAIDRQQVDVILLGAHLRPVIRHMRPDVYFDKRTIDIGWGSFWGHGVDGGLPKVLQNRQAQQLVGRVLVIASSKQQFMSAYPSYTNFLKEGYVLVHEDVANNVWCGYFSSKSRDIAVTKVW